MSLFATFAIVVCAALAAYFAFADPFDAFSCVAAVWCSLLFVLLSAAFAAAFLVHRQLNPTLTAFDLPKCQEQFYN